MKKLLVLLSCYFIMGNYGYGQSPSFQTYINPVIPGDHPDCTLTKRGNDFYTINNRGKINVFYLNFLFLNELKEEAL